MVTNKDKNKPDAIEGPLNFSSLEVTRVYLALSTISHITKAVRKGQRMTQSDFITSLCEKLPGVEISDKVVNHWESGRQAPAYLFLVGVVRSYGDWRYDWALDCLQALRPDLWGTESGQQENPSPCPLPAGEGQTKEEA